MTEPTWIVAKCYRCREETVHEHTEGISSKARWQENTCLTCGRVHNITMRYKTLESA